MILLLALGCGAAPTEIAGRVVDALTGSPLAEASGGEPLRVIGAALGAPEEGCAEIAAQVGPEGRFVLPDGCPGTRYALALSDGARQIDAVEVIGGAFGEIEIQAWPFGPDGVWEVGEAGLLGLPPQATAREDVLVSGAGVRFPDVLPSEVPVIGAGEWLLLSGGHAEAPIVPLLPAEAVSFGDPAAPRPIGPWSYLGARVGPAGAEPVTAAPEADKVVRHVLGGAPGAWIRGDALAPGTYAVEGPRRRLYVVRFGE